MATDVNHELLRMRGLVSVAYGELGRLRGVAMEIGEIIATHRQARFERLDKGELKCAPMKGNKNNPLKTVAVALGAPAPENKLLTFLLEPPTPDSTSSVVSIELTNAQTEELNRMRGEMSPSSFLALLLTIAGSGAVHGANPLADGKHVCS